MTLLSDNEIEKHDIWFKAKMIPKNEFIEHVNVWLSTPVTCQETSEGVTDVNVNGGCPRGQRFKCFKGYYCL